MKCPVHKNVDLKSAVFYNTEVDFCPKGLGIWFEEDELRIAKDAKDKNLEWLDVDLWKEKSKFKISQKSKMCPKCEVPMYEISYGESDVKVDICNVCRGIWLDRGEFKKIVEYLREKSGEKIMKDYAKVLVKETAEVFVGPESLQEELSDLVTVITLLKHKLSVKIPTVAEIIAGLPKT